MMPVLILMFGIHPETAVGTDRLGNQDGWQLPANRVSEAYCAHF